MITVKYNIKFKKALKVLEENQLEKFTNNKLAPQTAKLAQKYIRSGKVTPKLSENNPRGIKAKPLFDTRKLHDSLKGGTQGVSGVSYAKKHRQDSGRANKRGEIIAYPWKGLDVPQREFIPHYEDNEKGTGVIALKGTGKDLKKMYDVFKKKFVKLIVKEIKSYAR